MQRSDIRSAIITATEWDPDTTAYQLELNRLINDAYFELWDAAPWSWAERTVEMPIHRDRTPDRLTTATTITPDMTVVKGTKMTASGNTFTPDDIGADLEIGGREYEIVEVQSPTVCYVQPRYQGATGAQSDWTIRHRRYWLPRDCARVLECRFADRPYNSGPIGQAKPVPQGRAGGFGLDMRATTNGVPQHWEEVDPVVIPKPAETPTYTGVLTGATIPAGTYYLGFCYRRGNSYGPVSEPIGAAITLGFQINLTTAESRVGHSKALCWGELQSDNTVVWYLSQPSDSALRWEHEQGHDTTLTSLTEPFDDKYQCERHGSLPGVARSIRFWPRPDGTSTTHTITRTEHEWSDLREASWWLRYRFTPPRLDADTDVPIGHSMGRAIVDKVAADLLGSSRLDNPTMAAIHLRKLNTRLDTMRAQFASGRDAPIRRGASYGMTEPGPYDITIGTIEYS